MEPDLIDAIDRASADDPDKPTQSEMIRRLLRDNLIRLGYLKP